MPMLRKKWNISNILCFLIRVLNGINSQWNIYILNAEYLATLKSNLLKFIFPLSNIIHNIHNPKDIQLLN